MARLFGDMPLLRWSRAGWRAIAVGALVAPALSLLAAIASVWLDRALGIGPPLGMHTLLPLVVVLPPPVVAGVAVALLPPALLLALSRSGSAGRPRVLTTAAVLLAAQLVFYGTQLVAVDQLRGVPDPTAVILATAALQILVVAIVAAGVSAIARSLRPMGTPASVRLVLSGPPRPVPGPPAIARPNVFSIGSRRGPPALLLSD